MAYTPVELRHVRLPRRLFGYRRSTTDRLFEEVADSFEEVWRERGDLADKVEQLENDLVRYRELEALLRTTLVSAERASQEGRDQGGGAPGKARGGADPLGGPRRGPRRHAARGSRARAPAGAFARCPAPS